MMCEYWHHMEVYEVQFGIYISSYEVYRTGKPCNIGRICTPMVYIPANTAELPCPLQVIQRIILYPKLHFIIFSYMMSAFALLIFYLSSAMPWTVSHRFLPAPSAYPVRQGAYAFPVRALCIGWCVHSMCTYPDDARCLLCPIHVIRAYISPTLCP